MSREQNKSIEWMRADHLSRREALALAGTVSLFEMATITLRTGGASSGYGEDGYGVSGYGREL